MLASRLSQHHKYLLQSPCWHPGSPQLFSPCPYPKPVQLKGFVFLYNPAILPCVLLVLGPLLRPSLLFSLPLSLSLSLLSRPSSVYRPCVVYYSISLLWTPLHIDNKSFPSAIPWSGHVLILYSYIPNSKAKFEPARVWLQSGTPSAM